MKVGDLVKLRANRTTQGVSFPVDKRTFTFSVGIVVEFTEKKCWRTHELGIAIKWHQIEPEPHAVVMFKNDEMQVPVIDLEVVSSALSDDQLEFVIGGASPAAFSQWRAETLNENR
jgi:hypothetical protein